MLAKEGARDLSASGFAAKPRLADGQQRRRFSRSVQQARVIEIWTGHGALRRRTSVVDTPELRNKGRQGTRADRIP